MGDSPSIKGSSVSMFGSIGNTDCGLKQEFKLNIELLKWFGLSAHEEIKSGCANPPGWKFTDAYPSDLLTKGIFKNETALALLKGAWLWFKPLTNFSFGLGVSDVGRDLTTTGFGDMGLKTANYWSRTPHAPFVERPPNHIFSGAVPGFWALLTQAIDNNHSFGYNLFAGITSGQPKSSGLAGYKMSPNAEEPKNTITDPIVLFSNDQETPYYDNPLWQGYFLTVGGGLVFKIEETKIAFNASLSQKQTWVPPETGESPDPAQNMVYAGFAFERNKVSGYADYTGVFQDEAPALHGLRVGLQGRVYENKPKTVGLDLFGAGIFMSSPEKKDITEIRTRLKEVPCYDDEGHIITTQTCYEDVEEEVAIGSEVSPHTGGSVMGGFNLEVKPKKKSPVTLSLSASGGVLTDSNPLSPNTENTTLPVWSTRFGFSYKF